MMLQGTQFDHSIYVQTKTFVHNCKCTNHLSPTSCRNTYVSNLIHMLIIYPGARNICLARLQVDRWMEKKDLLVQLRYFYSHAGQVLDESSKYVLRLDFHFSGLFSILYYITAINHSDKGYLYSQCRATTADKQVAICTQIPIPSQL